MPIYFDDVTNGEAGAAVPIGASQKVSITVPISAGLVSADGTQVISANISFSFFTTANPIYADVDYIMLEGGPLVESVPEASIYNMIFASSTLVDDMLLFDPATAFPDTTTRQYRFFNRARTEFVKCRVLAELYRAIISSKGTSAGRKALADFSIDQSSLAGLINQARPMINDFIKCYQHWQKVLESGAAVDFDMPSPRSAVKAGNTPDGIGRGWCPDSDALSYREDPVQSGDTYTRPVRYGNRHPNANYWES